MKTHTSAIVLIPPPRSGSPSRPSAAATTGRSAAGCPTSPSSIPSGRPGSSSCGSFAASGTARGASPFWLAPEPAGLLLALETALRSVVPDCDDQIRHAGGFHPHLRVGQFQGKAEALEEFLAALQASWTPLRFTASEVSLIRRGDPPDDVFHVNRLFPLG